MPVRTEPEPAFDRAQARERVLKAAVVWVYDKSCSEALLELDEAVTNLIGEPIGNETSGAQR